MFKIAGEEIKKGESKKIDVNIARLPSGTSIDIPVFVHRSKKDGPTLLLLAGMHGDEINGVEIVRRIIREKLYKVEAGAVICIPIMNIYGFINFSRDVPDGKDINRSFPGTKTGSLASQVAHFLMEEIIPHIDYGIDFHTGGARINNTPQIRVKVDDPMNLELAKAFNTKFILNSPFRDRSLRKEAFKLDKRILVYEGGESLRLRKNAIDEGIEGMLRVMKHLKMRSDAPAKDKESIVIMKSSWIRAKSAGLHYGFQRNGSSIEKKEVLGRVCDPYGTYEVQIKSPLDGYIIAINNNPVVNRGDALFHVGS
ncbi:succinylglutamate desuccinylase/aspartoacylase family protein [Marinoscillum pacificum]|uniref:succinylglutamate desuccinylase/aspartoacylase family protein n=1 Tax=Marinoscillum pacificum TaxID=392723 RepID=UPI0021583AB7|nr:succinylglutamate desuccinylase/aspartoacylase family protein [Marinoscillum pacificum]